MPVIPLFGTPDLLGLHAANPQRYPFLLQTLGCVGWDILFAFPQQTILSHGLTGGDVPFLERLDEELALHSGPAEPDSAFLPFHGGWFVYLGYELLHQLEPSVTPKGEQNSFPVAALVRIPAAILIHKADGRAYAFAEQKFAPYLEALCTDFATPTAPFAGRHLELTDLQEENPQIFIDGVAQVKHYIREGDVFQVNLARRWQAQIAPVNRAAEVYARLRESNPAPFSGIADFGRHQIISSSPERLAKVEDEVIETRPIAGTHPRASQPDTDRELRQQLITSPKERAEHIMLVDLERNDLGRVCEPGSIEVSELMAVCSYAHVHHIESSVRGRLRPQVGPSEIIRALFPGGTITGCPKVRTMQIINELEVTPRNAYTGSMGYLNLDGGMDLNILIRSFMLDGRILTFKAGAGIVADSDADRELAETRAKAKGLLRSLGVE